MRASPRDFGGLIQLKAVAGANLYAMEMLESGPKELASVCRREANVTLNPDTAAALLRMAEIYEEEANEAYGNGPTKMVEPLLADPLPPTESRSS